MWGGGGGEYVSRFINWKIRTGKTTGKSSLNGRCNVKVEGKVRMYSMYKVYKDCQYILTVHLFIVPRSLSY